MLTQARARPRVPAALGAVRRRLCHPSRAVFMSENFKNSDECSPLFAIFSSLTRRPAALPAHLHTDEPFTHAPLQDLSAAYPECTLFGLGTGWGRGRGPGSRWQELREY